MQPLPSKCPICGGEIIVTRIYCRECDSTIEGRFTTGSFENLTPEQLSFVETFVRCEGKITRMEDEIGLSYPTIRNRLHEVIRAMGYEPGADEPVVMGEEGRRKILERLEKGDITYQEAMSMLREGEV
ncbi:MAG TPA: DUF2089 domain-containing protein [Anaerolineales bacterium]|nr:DUF2089 domain-containing protein [Anaerolineales bacterium]